jgi:hypothetical protein
LHGWGGEAAELLPASVMPVRRQEARTQREWKAVLPANNANDFLFSEFFSRDSRANSFFEVRRWVFGVDVQSF